jgi:hypothetical protein
MNGKRHTSLETCSSSGPFKPAPRSSYTFQNGTSVPSRATYAFGGFSHPRISLIS